MKKILACALSLAIAAAALLVARPVTTDAAASALYVTQSCGAGGVSAHFSWQGANPAALVTWMDVSITNNGFAPGSYYGLGPMSGYQSSTDVSAMLPGVLHYVRINQMLPGGYWDTSTTFSFTTQACGGGGSYAPPVSYGGAPGGSGPVISNLTCYSSLSTATLGNVPVASSQTTQLTALPYDTITCNANIAGGYQSLSWLGPQTQGSGASFTTGIGGVQPGNVPYDISLTVNWGGNPATAHVAVQPIVQQTYYPGYYPGY